MKNVLELLENTAALMPDKVGFCDRENRITFSEMKVSAEQIGSSLVNGEPGEPIVIFCERNTACIQAMFGVVYAGCCYAVVDVKSPENRISEILNQLKARIIIADNENKVRIGEILDAMGKGAETEVLALDEIIKTPVDEEFLSERRKGMTEEDPLYILFTSGSSGVPKGAVLTHRNVLSYIEWYTGCFDINENTVFGSQTPLYFSMSVSDLFATIRAGAEYVIIDKALFAFPATLVEFMNEHRINTIYWVPSAMALALRWKLFEEVKPQYLEKVLFAGEVMPVKVLNYWRKHLPDALYANLFGPTETTDICTYYVINREFEPGESIPIGRSCDNCRAYILDEVDGVGELAVAGPFVAKGYYNDDINTAKAFVMNPLNTAYPEPVYRTGDLVRVNSYGEFEYVCRKDFQIKRQGYRIELGEIEAAANAIDSIRTAAAVYNDEEKQIVLFYEGKKDENLRAEMAKRVPNYMVPDKIVKLRVMPLNANGKISRSELRDMLVNGTV